jgi:long-subunit acyl-CoA synthetase (AMP-forming)
VTENIFLSSVFFLYFPFSGRPNRILSYLPLSHVAACLFDIHAPILVRGTTYFADKNALKARTNLGTNPPKFMPQS